MGNSNDFNYAKEKYKMTEEECNEMYQETRNLIFNNCIPEQDIPTAIVTGGQPGSGKSGIVIKSKLDFANTGKESVVLDVDTYRGLYKNASSLAKEFPQFYSELTDPVVGQIMSKLLDEAISNKYNFIFEGTLGNTQIFNTIGNSGVKYKTIARIMAVSRYESLLSIFERYIEMNKYMTIGRLTSIEAHDVRYNNFTKILPTLEKNNIEVEVFKRSKDKKVPTMIYKTSSNKNLYRSVMEAVNAGREESYMHCMNNAKERIELINSDMKNCNVDKKIKNELDKLNEIFKKELNKDIDKDR